MPSTTTVDIADNILAQVVLAVGRREWERRLAEPDRELVRACCADAARLALRTLATPARLRPAHTELLREKARIHALLAESTALGASGALADAFWVAFGNTVNGAVAVAFTAV